MFGGLLRNGAIGAATGSALLAVGAMTPASAVVIGGVNVGGPGSVFEVSSIYENVVTGIGQTLSGYGEVTQINGNNTFCSGGACELTYRFTGYTVAHISATEVVFTGGTVQFYVGFGANNDFNPFTSANSAADLAAATNGTPWLNLIAHNNSFTTSSFGVVAGTLFGAGLNIGSGNDSGTGTGILDVDLLNLAMANGNFDTNSQPDNLGGFGDFTLTSSFNNLALPHPSECTPDPTAGLTCLSGSADLRGTVVPEPMSLGLLGAGLIGLGIVRRRKAA